MPQISYLLFDVFAEEPFQGNQLAVVPQHLDDRSMQTIANELNIAETVFLRSTGDPKRPAELRIFTPKHEVPFAGHPTVGATFAIAEVLKWVSQECTAFSLGERVGNVGVRVEREGGKLLSWLRTPPVTFEETLDRAQSASALGLSPGDLHESLLPQVISAGNPFVFIALRDKQAVDRAWFPAAHFNREIERHIAGVFVFALSERGTYARMFAPMSGIAEDPATGSATGPLYAYLRKYAALEGTRTSFISEQGVKLGRRSILHVRADPEARAVEVGGQSLFVGEGAFKL